jgi:hypothetical protein
MKWYRVWTTDGSEKQLVLITPSELQTYIRLGYRYELA